MSSLGHQARSLGFQSLGATNSADVNIGPGRCSILRLPDELLFSILMTSVSWDEDSFHAEAIDFRLLNAERRNVTLVCRQFNRIATPILYSRLTASLIVTERDERKSLELIRACLAGLDPQNNEEKSLPGDKVLLPLHRTIAADHSLGNLCRDLVFELGDTHWDDERFLRRGSDLGAWCTKTETLRLCDGFGERIGTTALFLKVASANMPRLKRLAFARRNTPLRVDDLFNASLQSPIARILGLKEVRLSGLDEASAEVVSRSETTKGTGQFTELSFYEYRATAEALDLILQWPARLNKFTCLGVCWDLARPECPALSKRSICWALRHHQLSLESIRIGNVYYPVPYPYRIEIHRTGSFDFTTFEFLTFLSLSYWTTGAGVKEQLLLAPSLHTFEWTFDTDDHRPLFLNDFRLREEEFLRRLAKAATTHEIPLRRISIMFTPTARIGVWNREIEYEFHEDSEDEDDRNEANFRAVDRMVQASEYPWNRMDRLAEEMRPSGIKLRYSKPSVSREVYDMIIPRCEARNAKDFWHTSCDPWWIYSIGAVGPPVDEF